MKTGVQHLDRYTGGTGKSKGHTLPVITANLPFLPSSTNSLMPSIAWKDERPEADN
jgi:hypothetical protein